jgi:hypothetical protein
MRFRLSDRAIIIDRKVAERPLHAMPFSRSFGRTTIDFGTGLVQRFHAIFCLMHPIPAMLGLS